MPFFRKNKGELRVTKHIVVLGGGYGGLKIISNFICDRRFKGDYKITLIDRTPYHSLKTEFYALAAGTLSDKDTRIEFPIDERLSYVHGEIIDISLDEEKVLLKDKDPIEYDCLVIALGSEDNYHQIIGAKDHTSSIQSIEKARKTHEKVMNLPQGSSVHIIGGGLSGVEFAAELRESRRDLKIAIMDRGDGVLKPFDEKIRNHVSEWLHDHNVEVIADSNVDYIEEGVICNRGVCLQSDAILWTAGVKPSRLVESLPAKKDEQGRLIIDEYYRLPDYKNAFVVGDCASSPYSPSGQLAAKQAEQVGKILKDALRGVEISKPKPIHLNGVLGSLGHHDGFGVIGKSSWTGSLPRLAKTGVLWLHKRH